MKIRHIILGIGALAAGAAVLYYLTKEKAVAEVQPASVKETPPAEPEVSEEDKAILDDIFEPEETTEVTKKQGPKAEEVEAAAETVTEPTVTSVEKPDAAVSAFKPAPGNRRIGQYDEPDCRIRQRYRGRESRRKQSYKHPRLCKRQAEACGRLCMALFGSGS